MEQSILIGTKKILGLEADYHHFDLDIMTHINSILAVLTQLGIGPTDGFMVEDESATWSNFIGDDSVLSMVKTYVYLRVSLLFDPPQTPHLITVKKEQYQELEYRISAHREASHWTDPEPDVEDPIFDRPVLDAGHI